MGGRGPEENLHPIVRGLRPSATLAINERCRELERDGRQVFRLGLGQSPFPVPRTVVEALRAHASQKDYLPVRGLEALRDAVARYHARRQGIPCTGDDVIIGPGSKELMFLLQLAYDGELVIPTPSWVSYEPQARILGRPVRWVPTRAEEGWRLLPGALERLCAAEPGRPRILILNYPANPHGGSYTSDELAALAETARRLRIVVLSDEIYGELHYEGAHQSIARHYPEGTIVSGGLSKWCGAGGWRLGTFTFPRSMRWLLQAMAAVASETYTSTSAPIQFAAVRAFEGGTEIERYLWRSRRVLGALARALTARLRAAGARVVDPAGAFYLFPDFGDLREPLRARGIEGSAALCERLLEETGVAMLPGRDFGRPPEELTARIAFVDFDGARALEALAAAPTDFVPEAAFVESLAPNLFRAFDRLAAWLGAVDR